MITISMFLYVILLTHRLEYSNRRVSVVRTNNPVRTAKPTRKGKGTTFNRSLLRIINQSFQSTLYWFRLTLLVFLAY